MVEEPDYGEIARVMAQHPPDSPVASACRFAFVGVLVGLCIGGFASVADSWWGLGDTLKIAVHTAGAAGMVGYIRAALKNRKWQKLMEAIAAVDK